MEMLVCFLVVELELLCVPRELLARYALGDHAKEHHLGELTAVVAEV